MHSKFAILSALLLTGCLVQSLQPFHTPATTVEVPELTGQWELLTAWGEPVPASVPVWKFTPDEILTWDHKTNSSPVKVKYFRLGDNLFANTSVEPTGNWYQLWHLRPVHTVARVILAGDTVEFRPLDFTWFTNCVAQTPLAIPHITADDFPLYNWSPRQWEQFLTTHGDTNAFPPTHRYILKKR